MREWPQANAPIAGLLHQGEKLFEVGGIQLEVSFDELLEEIAFLFFREIPSLGLDVLP